MVRNSDQIQENFSKLDVIGMARNASGIFATSSLTKGRS